MRIIAGKHRRRVLATPKDDAIRPTADRVRESIFSILGDFGDLTVVDAYAGTGALGCEALSRGARKVWFFDSSRRAVELVRKNIETLGEGEAAIVVPSSFERGIAVVDEAIDVVFLDPPYRSEHGAAALALLASSEHVTSETVVVLEQDRDEAPPEDAAFEVSDGRIYGTTRVTFYRRIA